MEGSWRNTTYADITDALSLEKNCIQYVYLMADFPAAALYAEVFVFLSTNSPLKLHHFILI